MLFLLSSRRQFITVTRNIFYRPLSTRNKYVRNEDSYFEFSIKKSFNTINSRCYVNKRCLQILHSFKGFRSNINELVGQKSICIYPNLYINAMLLYICIYKFVYIHTNIYNKFVLNFRFPTTLIYLILIRCRGNFKINLGIGVST